MKVYVSQMSCNSLGYNVGQLRISLGSSCNSTSELKASAVACISAK